MADIITGTVSGMVDTSQLVRDTANLRRETALEAGDIRRDVVKESRHVSDGVNVASNVGQRDASNYYIAETAASNQTAKEAAKERAWIEAGMNAGFVKSAGDIALSAAIINGNVALEAAKSNGVNSLAHAALALQIAQEANSTRALMQANRIDELRDSASDRYAKIVDIEGDKRDCDRNYDNLSRSLQQNQWASMQNQLQMLSSDLQSTKQSVISFGAGSATGGATTSNIAH